MPACAACRSTARRVARPCPSRARRCWRSKGWPIAHREDGPPAGWSAWQASDSHGTLTWDRETGTSGRGSARAAGIGNGCFLQHHTAEPGRHYAVRALCRRQGPGDAWIRVRWQTAEGTWTAEARDRLFFCPGPPGTWNEIFGVVEVPEGAGKLVVLLDVVQVIYNLFEQEPAAELLPTAAETGTGVIVRVAFDEGVLTGKYTKGHRFPADDFRSRYFAGDRLDRAVERVEQIRADVAEAGLADQYSLAEVALKFALAHPAVSTVIPGIRNPRQAELNAAASDKPDLPEPLMKKLRRHNWLRGVWYGGK